MSFGNQPRTRVPTVVLALCVAACLANCLWPRPPRPSPEEDAAVLLRAVLTHVLNFGRELPPAR